MNLYHWNSKLLANYSDGDIVVMAENVEQARDKVYALFDPLKDDGPFEDHYLKLLRDMEDEDYLPEFMEKLNQLREDLAKEPTAVTSHVVCIRGSD